MTDFSTDAVEVWEHEGGAASPPDATPVPSLEGSESQIEWAVRIRKQVDHDFDRVAAAFRVVAGKQGQEERAGTQAIIAILEEKRAQVMIRREAGYFIHDWQELTDQVRQLIFNDPRYQAIKSQRRPTGIKQSR